MNNFPKISVITPSYNSGKYIEQAIQNVLLQNYPNFEHIIVDGGSTDGTLDILKKHSHLKWISEPDNGQSDAMNKGFKMSSGEIIVYLNADDYFEVKAFQRVMDFFGENPDVSFVVGKLKVLDSQGNYWINDPKISFKEMLYWWKPDAFSYNSSAYFYKRGVQEKVGPFDEKKHYALDYDFLLRVSLHYKLFKINETLGNYRYIKGTKTYESCKTDHSKKQLEFAKEFWKYLKLKESFLIRFSWSYYNDVSCCGKLLRFIMRVITKMHKVTLLLSHPNLKKKS